MTTFVGQIATQTQVWTHVGLALVFYVDLQYAGLALVMSRRGERVLRSRGLGANSIKRLWVHVMKVCA